MRTGILIFALCLSSLFAVDAEFRADSLNGSLGEIISFGWDISHGEGALLTFSEMDLEGTGIEVLGRELTTTETGSHLQYNTAVYDSVGPYSFPPAIVYIQTGQELDSLFLRGPDLEITSILSAADTTFRDIKGIHTIRTPINLFYIVLIFVVLGVLTLIYILIKRLKKSTVPDEQERVIIPPEEAHVLALRSFDALKKSKYIRFEQFKEFYSELTHILKQYYENRYLIDALDQTTSEFLLTMDAMSDFDAEMMADTQSILEKADFIKFAKARTDELESGKALTLAIDLVNRTKIEPNQGDKT